MRVPVQAESLCLVSNKLNLWVDFAWGGRLKRMLCTVKDEDLAVNAERGNNVGILRLVAGLVDLTRVFDLLYNVTLDGGSVSSLAVAANLTTILIVVVWVGRSGLGYLDIGDLHIVGAVV